MEYQELKEIYQSKNELCEKLGKIYSHKKGEIYPVKCNKWTCQKCRPKKKYLLYLDILQYVYLHNLQIHFVITFEGQKLRKEISWEQSYKYMNKQWDNFEKTIKYNFYERYTKKGEYAPYIGENFTYIVLPRAQQSGYCHYHVLLNKEIPWEYLDNIRKNYKMGYMSIQKNKDVAEYLNTDFFKDHEWVIPADVRHYRTSQDIKINFYKKPAWWKDENIYFTHEAKMETIESKINDKFKYPLPFSEYAKKFSEVVK